ncbi:MAG: helix-turn-helix domain-containing protein [Odoribacter sp.]
MKTLIEQYVIDKIREKRLQQKMSQATLAYCLNVSKGFIGDIENPNKRAKYNLNHLNILAIIFNCPFTDFFPSEPFPEDNDSSTDTK